ncbi:hypothetical protein OAQ35_04035 [Litorivicinus sp.]|nr:hypothetical protein [Litorivicinus sp.]
MKDFGCSIAENIFTPDDPFYSVTHDIRDILSTLIASEDAANDEIAKNIFNLDLTSVEGHIVGARRRGVIHHSVLSQAIFRDVSTFEDRICRMVEQSMLMKFLQNCFDTPVIDTTNLAFRIRSNSSNPELALPYHQDCSLWNQADMLAGSDRRFIGLIAWVPLMDVGELTPGLQLIRSASADILPISATPKTQFTHLEVDFNDDGRQTHWTPTLKKGSSILFSGTTLHRSDPDPLKTDTRLSVDLRFFDNNLIPAALENHRMRSLKN